MVQLDETQVWNILTELQLDIEYETDTDYVGFCPFHYNVHSPAFCISKSTGVFFCQNASCAQRGTLKDLIKKITKYSELKIDLMIHQAAHNSNVSLRDRRKAQRVELPTYEQEKIDRGVRHLSKSHGACHYLTERGIYADTAEFFNVGYDPNLNMIQIPMYDDKGNPLGVVGRSIIDKQFKNSPKLPKKIVPWNIHNAKRYTSVVVTEACMDSMHVHQSGYPGTVALLGSYFSDHHAEAFDKYFDTIILAVDDDDSGNALAEQIINKLPQKRIQWAMLGGLPRYDGCKDMAQLGVKYGQQYVKRAVEQAMSNLQYRNLFDNSTPSMV